MENPGAEMVSIPARSPDINFIENFFELVGKALVEDTKNKNITKETFEEFSARVQNIIVNLDRKAINSYIGSMDKRKKTVIKAKGQRTNY